MNTSNVTWIFISNNIIIDYGWLVGLMGFMSYQPLQVILSQIHFYVNNLFFFKQFSLA